MLFVNSLRIKCNYKITFQFIIWLLKISKTSKTAHTKEMKKAGVSISPSLQKLGKTEISKIRGQILVELTIATGARLNPYPLRISRFISLNKYK